VAVAGLQLRGARSPSGVEREENDERDERMRKKKIRPDQDRVHAGTRGTRRRRRNKLLNRPAERHRFPSPQLLVERGRAGRTILKQGHREHLAKTI
jgi:hypothetical protein